MIRIVLLIITIHLSLFALSTKQLSHAINEAGRLRMLSQKIAKDALLLTNNTGNKKIVRTLQKDSKTFEAILEGLQQGNSKRKLKPIHNQKVQEQIHATRLLWQKSQKEMRQLLTNPTSKTSIEAIVKGANPLSTSADGIVQSLLKLSRSKVSSPRANSLNLCGKERMLSQKIAKALLAHHTQEAQESLKMFQTILDGLIHGSATLHLKPTKLPKVRTQLQEAKQLFQKIHCNTNTISACDQLLEKMDHITKLYEKSIRREQKSLALSQIVQSFMTQKNQLTHALNLAGRERMLTQKIAKDALALSFDPQANGDLTKTMNLFDETIRGLENGSQKLHLKPLNDPHAKKRLHTLTTLWQPFKKQLQMLQNNQGDLAWILTHDSALLEATKKVVKAIRQSSHSDLLQKAREHIVDIAGSQRMLLQQMTKARFMIDLHLHEKSAQKVLAQTMARFETQLEWLIKGAPKQDIPKPSNPKLIHAYQTIRQAWNQLKPQLIQAHPDIKELVTLNQQSDRLLKQLDESVSLAANVREY